MIVDNKPILKVKNTKLLHKLEQISYKTIEVIDSKVGIPTFTINNNGQQIYYHSKYNPLQEAKALIEKEVNVETEYVLFIGLGLGYGVQELISEYSKVKISIFEPNLEVLKYFLEHFNLSQIKTNKLDCIYDDINEVTRNSKLIEVLANKNSKIIVHPLYLRLYSKELKILTEELKKFLESKKSSTITDLAFQLRWLENSIVNFNEVIKSPNLFEDIDLTQFKDKPALIVAAGPSLDLEIDKIKQIKSEKRAYIFAVGSAVNALIANDIIPDALFSYDPLKNNAKVVQKVKDLNLNIPLIFGSSVGHETLNDYPGQKIHFFTSQDSISPNLVNSINRVIVPDAPTIAAVTLLILAKLQMGPIILVGQNLSYTKEKTYADGISYIDNKTENKNLKNHLSMISTTGEEVFTSRGYLEMRSTIEMFIRQANLNGKVFNSTFNGLPVEGAPYWNMEAILEFILAKKDIVSELEFVDTNHYDKKLANEKFKELENEFDQLIQQYKKALEIEKEISNAYENKVINNAMALFQKYDKVFNKIENNIFFIRVIAPVTRVQFKEFLEDAVKIREEIRLLPKMKLFLDSHSSYLRTMYAAIYQIQPAFEQLKKLQESN